MNGDLCKYFGLAKAKKTQRLILLGASGSIGQTSLDFLGRNSEIQLVALSVHTSVDFVKDYLERQKKAKDQR